MRSAFIPQMWLAAFRGPIRFPLYPVIRETDCCIYVWVNWSAKVDFGVGLTKFSSTIAFPASWASLSGRLPRSNQGNPATHPAAGITGQKNLQWSMQI